MIRRPIVSSLSILACLFLAVSPQSAAIPLPAQSAGVQLIGTVVDGALSPLAVAITLTRQGAVIARTTSDAAASGLSGSPLATTKSRRPTRTPRLWFVQSASALARRS